MFNPLLDTRRNDLFGRWGLNFSHCPHLKGSMPIEVLLADDAEIIRKGIRRLLRDQSDIVIVGEAATFPEAIQKAQELRPDIVVLDLRMAKGVTMPPNCPKVLAISIANDDEAKAEAIKMGASRLLDKMNLSQELIPAILELAPVGHTKTSAVSSA